MTSIPAKAELFTHVKGKTAIVTGGAGGIGSATVRLLYAHGANVVIADLPSARLRAETLISSLEEQEQEDAAAAAAHARSVIFIPIDLLDWDGMQQLLFKATIAKFGKLDIVVANAGMMESRPFYDFETDEAGDLREPEEAYRVLDVNLKGAMNTVRLAMFYMRSNPVDEVSGDRGSIVIVASTSGYFGKGGVVAYVSSKHGTIGLLRSSQRIADQLQLRVNGIAPFFTPTHITAGYAKAWEERGYSGQYYGRCCASDCADSSGFKLEGQLRVSCE